jgi:hypothetical protein
VDFVAVEAEARDVKLHIFRVRRALVSAVTHPVACPCPQLDSVGAVKVRLSVDTLPCHAAASRAGGDDRGTKGDQLFSAGI